MELIPAAAGYVTLFGLVLVRVGTLLFAGSWWFGHAAMPPRVKALFAMALALMITPAVADVPPATPSTVLDLLWLAVGEAALGGVLGMSVAAVLSGLQLAGDVIDQQAGIALGEVFNPSTGDSMSVTGTFLVTLTTAALLAAEPFGMEERILDGLLQTFRAFPPGEATMPSETAGITLTLLHQASVLGLRVAAPLLATMSLVSLVLGVLGATVPQVNVLVLGFAVRAAVSLVIVAATLSPGMEAALDAAFGVLDQLMVTLTPGEAV